MKSRGVKYCELCKERMPYDRMENREDSPINCLGCQDRANGYRE